MLNKKTKSTSPVMNKNSVIENDNKEFLYWFIPNNNKYFENLNKEKALEYIQTNLEKYIKTKYKDYKPIIIAADYPEKEIEIRNKNSINKVLKDKSEKVLHDLYNMEAEYYAEFEIRQSKKSAL